MAVTRTAFAREHRRACVVVGDINTPLTFDRSNSNFERPGRVRRYTGVALSRETSKLCIERSYRKTAPEERDNAPRNVRTVREMQVIKLDNTQ